jgi:deoxyribonuclease (pyrimidine dimer)
MTRINCIPPEELVNKHLLAEYRELPRIFALARGVDKPPKAYTLGTGHMLFFYDKLTFLVNRQQLIINELLKRKFNLAHTDASDLLAHHMKNGGNLPSKLWNDWEPTPEAILISRARINERLAEMASKQL